MSSDNADSTSLPAQMQYPRLPLTIAEAGKAALAQAEAEGADAAALATIRRLLTDRRAVAAWAEVFKRRRAAPPSGHMRQKATHAAGEGRPFLHPARRTPRVMEVLDVAARFRRHARQAERLGDAEDAARWRARAALFPRPTAEVIQAEAARQLLHAVLVAALVPSVRVMTPAEAKGAGIRWPTAEPFRVARQRGDSRQRAAIVFLGRACRELFGSTLHSVVADLVGAAFDVRLTRATVQRTLMHTVQKHPVMSHSVRRR